MTARGFEQLLESLGKLAAIVLWLGMVSYGWDQLALRQQRRLHTATGLPRDTAGRMDRARKSSPRQRQAVFLDLYEQLHIARSLPPKADIVLYKASPVK